jgi:hypothetical protein
MNAVDAMVLALLALADITLIIHLRRRRARKMRVEHMYHTLTLAVRRELAVGTVPVHQAAARKRWAGDALPVRGLLKRPALEEAPARL